MQNNTILKQILIVAILFFSMYQMLQLIKPKKTEKFRIFDEANINGVIEKKYKTRSGEYLKLEDNYITYKFSSIDNIELGGDFIDIANIGDYTVKEEGSNEIKLIKLSGETYYFKIYTDLRKNKNS